MSEGGEPNQGKRTLLNTFSLLVLNKSIVTAHKKKWTDDDIYSRSTEIALAIAEIWPGPEVSIQLLALEQARGDR